MIEDAEREIINALEGSDWAFRDNAPIRLNECAATNKVRFSDNQDETMRRGV